MQQIKFTFETEAGPFSDTLYLPDDHTYTDAEIEGMKQERVNNWLAIVNEQPSGTA